MTYIYDILLNFNKELYEFYEWEKGDKLLHIKKIPIYKVNTKVIEDIILKKIKINDNFIDTIKVKTELFGNKKNKYLHAFLLTDGYKVIAILINENNEINKLSDLLLDEALDTINISSRLDILNFEYNIIGNRKFNHFLTRNELEIKTYLTDELKKIHKNKEIEKLKYLYFEYFNKYNDNIDIIYKELKKTLKNQITNNHLNLYNILNLKDSWHIVDTSYNLTNNH